ncbi:MAG: amino acid adenylation domain-containing protein, partial [bacterium]|nr:amino acid adenylation domain-containing protein [bacterium]
SKLSGQEDIITGTPIAARRHTDLQNIIGMFGNTLGMRNFPVGGKRFDEFLVELKERVLGAFENQEYQFEDLVEKVSVQRNPGRNPVFDVMFNLLNQSETGTEGSPPPANGEPDSYEHIKRSSKFDLNLTAKERSTTVFFNFQYSTKLFSPPTIDRFIRYFRNTILQLTESTGIRLEEIDILPEKEKENILVMSRGIKEPYHGTTIHRLFEEKAKRVPQHSALIFNGSHLSYAELNRRANQVAALLKQKGAGSDSIVGLTVNRSFEMIIGMLGIIKAGAAYLPVDPEYPEERKKIMLEDSRTKILLTDSESETAGTAYIHRDVDVINLKEKGLYHGSGDTPNLSGHSGHMVYIMYTSGSTGKPKGVMLEHRNVANLIHYQLKHTNIDFARVLQFTTISFDVSFQEIATTLAAGGQLFLIEKEIRNNIPGLFGLIEKQRIRTLFLPASYLKFVLGQEDYISLLPADVRHIVTAGEQLVVPDAFREYLRTRNVWLHNHYGPSETHVVTALSMSPEGPHPELPSIGRPILNTGIYILDKTKKLQVTGAPGELAIGGIQVGRGYWLNETWTRETFIANPFAPGERLYCSGDLARWLPDGNIQFLGRIDQQVKIRGFRVEPGEIENHLLNIEHIKECAVLVKNSENGEPHLCAYIVAATGVAVSRLRELLARHLPEYMIPTAFTFVETIPLTPNGKIDRKALPQPEIKLQKEYVAPRNQTEVRLLRLWSEVLKVRAELIGIDTDFFLLGGHSLKATILLSKIHKEFSIALSLGEMFQATTIRKLAGCIRDAVKKEYAAIEPAEKKEYYSASSPQKRLYILQQMEVGNTGYNMPYNILPQEKIDKNKLEIVFRKLIVRHESLRTSFHIINDRPVQKIHYKTNFKIDYYKITENEAETIINEFKRPFNLSQAPLLRVALLEIESSHHQALLIDMHHIITDGTSQDILGKEFAALYAGEQLPLIKLQYRDYSEWQNLKEQQEWVKGQEHYWINRFSDELPVLNLPNDYPRPVIQSFEGAVVSFVLNVPESRALKHIARESDATLYMIILALYTVLLSKLSGQEDIIVGTPIAARRHADLQNIIGMFVNTLAMRNYPAAARTFKEFLIELKGRVLKAFENQEYQFEDLVEKISITRDTGRNPLFDIMFNLLNITTSGSEILPHRENSGLQHIEAASKFDMTLTASEYSGAISFRLLYAVTLFKKETIDRIIVYLKKILKTVTSNPDIKIDVIDIIPETIKNEILTHFNQNLEDSFVLKPLQDKLFESFDKFCDCIAIRYGKSELSYRKLERNAVSISNWIIRKKFPKGSYFGIFMENRIDVVSVMIGILNAGCVFVPMDTSLPLKRLQAMLQVTGTGLIFTDVRNNEKLVEIADDNEPVNRTRIQSIIIDTTFYSANRPSATMKRTVDVHLDDSVYIYFTSGTTGTPKAITGINKSLLQFILWEIEMFEIAPSFRISQLTALGFDAFLRDVFTTLCAGGTVCIPDNREMILESEKIVKWIDMNGISLIHCVPSVFRVFNTSWLTSANFGRLKYILLSGEALNPYELVDWQIVFGERIHLVNLYGPTETTMVCTNYFISHHDLNRSSIPIGNPIRGVRLIRLDKGLNVCAHDQVGEIYIRTPYSTAGYCNEPRATGEKFIPNPFLQKNGDVIYRTGDLAREAEDGNIHLLGRIDRQVKIRGVRIELVDIEASLIALPGIKGAVALLKQYKDEKYLCAYYVESRPTHPKSNPQHPASDIHHPATNFRELLAQTLPTYMLPDFFIKIDSIPLTPNGKIDKKALSKFQISDFKSQTFIAPRNETEEKLADLWADVLNLDKSVIGIDSDFFQLGGHSLKATILVSKIHRKLNMLISLAEFFQAPTIRRLAQNF